MVIGGEQRNDVRASNENRYIMTSTGKSNVSTTQQNFRNVSTENKTERSDNSSGDSQISVVGDEQLGDSNKQSSAAIVDRVTVTKHDNNYDTTLRDSNKSDSYVVAPPDAVTLTSSGYHLTPCEPVESHIIDVAVSKEDCASSTSCIAPVKRHSRRTKRLVRLGTETMAQTLPLICGGGRGLIARQLYSPHTFTQHATDLRSFPHKSHTKITARRSLPETLSDPPERHVAFFDIIDGPPTSWSNHRRTATVSSRNSRIKLVGKDNVQGANVVIDEPSGAHVFVGDDSSLYGTATITKDSCTSPKEPQGDVSKASSTTNYLKDQIIAFFQPSDNKLAMKLFGNKNALDREKLRQKEAGNWVIHPCSNFRLVDSWYTVKYGMHRSIVLA